MRYAPTLLLVLLAFGCSKDPVSSNPNGTGEGENAEPNSSANNETNAVDVPTEPVVLDASEFTYRLEQSPAELPIWTTPITHRPTQADRPPEVEQAELRMSAARGEFEVLQLLVGPGTGAVDVSVAPFESLSAETELAVIGFESGWAERIGDSVATASVSGDVNAPAVVWFTVRVPDDAPAGEHTTTVSVGSATIPLTLYVFDFSIREERNFKTQMNVNVSALVGDGSVDDAKSTLFDLRFTPKSVTWPSGFNPSITWDNGAAPCEEFWDEPDEGDQYAVGALARRYIHGEGWNGIGFPSAMLFQFVDNSTPRPDTFCGLDRGDHFGSDAYNAEWSQFLGALETYLRDNDYLDKGYWYVQNEPQDDEDARLAAHLCRMARAAAPDLRIAVSEEPTPSIAENADGGCGYDIWIAHVRAYQEDYARQRQRDFDEEVWFYSLDQDPDPYPNPTRVDQQGVHMRIWPWISWGYRVRGYAYYDANRWFDGTRPTVRGVLFREGFEDYEYLYLANGGAHPPYAGETAVDAVASSVASSLTSWTKDPDALAALRHELGLYIEGSRDTLPTLSVDDDTRPRAAYFINFQDPGGQPSAEPLTVDGETWLKIGWQPWDDELGYGWYGENIGTGIVQYGFDDVNGFSDVQKSYVYDDYGRDNLFEFAVPSGTWEVAYGVGRPSRGYPGDPHNLTIEGEKVVDDAVTTEADPVIEGVVTVEVNDGKLSVEAGGRSASTGDFAYTFLAWISLTPVDQ